MCSITAATLVAQLLHPHLLADLERDTARILAGQLWRPLTALFVQDSLPAGGITNISGLLLVGTVAEKTLGRREWLLVYGIGALLAEAVAMLWQPVGAGNSVAVCSLAGALVARGAPSCRAPLTLALRLAVTACATTLLFRRDIHGAALLAGAVLSVFLRAWRHNRDSSPVDARENQ